MKKPLTDIEFKIKLCRKHQMPIFKYKVQCKDCNGLGVSGYDKKSLPIPCKCVNANKVEGEMGNRKPIAKDSSNEGSK